MDLTNRRVDSQIEKCQQGNKSHIDFPQNPLLLGGIKLNCVFDLFISEANFDCAKAIESFSVGSLDAPLSVVRVVVDILKMLLSDERNFFVVHVKGLQQVD